MLQTTPATVASTHGAYELDLIDGDHISLLILKQGRPYEERLLLVANKLTRPGSHVLDIGANVGNHTIFWARSGRKVTAFEPNEQVREVLQLNVSRNGVRDRVEVLPWAVGATAGEGSLQALLPANTGAVAVRPNIPGGIQIRALDTLSLRNCDLIKIDVEGAESAVLKGAAVTLRRDRPWLIVESRAEDAATRELLHGLGYRRFPFSLATTETFLWSPSRRRLFAACRHPELWQAELRRLRGSVMRRLPEPVRRGVRALRSGS